MTLTASFTAFAFGIEGEVPIVDLMLSPDFATPAGIGFSIQPFITSRLRAAQEVKLVGGVGTFIYVRG